jgi:hypothetical protein
MAYTSAELYSAFPTTTDCKTLEQQIESLGINELYWRKLLDAPNADASANLKRYKQEKFNFNTCTLKLGDKKIQQTVEIGENFDASARAKIETDTNEAVTKRIIVGVSVIVLALGIILAFKKQ